MADEEEDLNNGTDDADFNDGFTTLAPNKALVVDKVPPPKEPAAEVVVTPPAAEPPKMATITQEDWDALRAQTTGMDKRIKETVAGTLGDVEQRIVKKLQAATPAGVAVELPQDIVDELAASHPELAPKIKSVLEKALKGLRGTAPAGKGSVSSEDVVELARKLSVMNEVESLDDLHPTWREIFGKVDAELKPVDPNNKFRKWLATQPEAYQHRINTTNSSLVLSRAIDKFQEFDKKPPAPPAPNIRKDAARNRIKDAVQPRGDGGGPTPSKTADDELEDGFAAG